MPSFAFANCALACSVHWPLSWLQNLESKLCNMNKAQWKSQVFVCFLFPVGVCHELPLSCHLLVAFLYGKQSVLDSSLPVDTWPFFCAHSVVVGCQLFKKLKCPLSTLTFFLCTYQQVINISAVPLCWISFLSQQLLPRPVIPPNFEHLFPTSCLVESHSLILSFLQIACPIHSLHPHLTLYFTLFTFIT